MENLKQDLTEVLQECPDVTETVRTAAVYIRMMTIDFYKWCLYHKVEYRAEHIEPTTRLPMPWFIKDRHTGNLICLRDVDIFDEFDRYYLEDIDKDPAFFA